MESLMPQKSQFHGDRFLAALTYLFAFSILIVGWGRTAYYSGDRIIFSFGGNTSGIVIPLFLLYGLYRIRARDLFPLRFWKDPVFFFSLYAALSPLWGEQKDFSLVKGYLFPALMGYWMASYLLRKSSGALTTFLIATLTCSIAMMVARGMSELPFIPGEVAIMHSTAEHHTTIAMMILMALPLTIAMASMTKGKARILPAALLFLFGSGIFLVSSRIGWVAFFCLCIFYLIRLPGLRLKALALGIPILLFGLFLLAFPHYMTRFASLGHLSSDLETSTRLQNWKVAGSLLERSYALGISFSNREYRARGRSIDSHFQYEHPHNLYLQIAVYCGIPGIILSLLILVKIAGGLRIWRARGDLSLSKAFEGGLLGLAVMNCADSAFNSHRAMLMVFMFLALLVHPPEPGAGREEAVPPGDGSNG
jgi:O-antigen ligase